MTARILILAAFALSTLALSPALAAPESGASWETTMEDCGVDDAGPLQVVSLAVGTGVTRRMLDGEAEWFTLDDTRVWAHVVVRNDGPPAKVFMLWSRDGLEVWRAELTVGKSPAWRTWSRRRLSARDVGVWTVDVVDEAGEHLAAVDFEVHPASVACADPDIH